MIISLLNKCPCKKKPAPNKHTEKNVETIKSKLGKNMFNKIQKDKQKAEDKLGIAEPQKINLVFEIGEENNLNLHKTEDTKSDSHKKIVSSTNSNKNGNQGDGDSDMDSQDQNEE